MKIKNKEKQLSKPIESFFSRKKRKESKALGGSSDSNNMYYYLRLPLEVP